MSSAGVAIPAESSDTTATQSDQEFLVVDNLAVESEDGNVTNEGEEQALESHEVIELQTFSERKAWIEERIKFLERMPPIEAFVGLDAVRASAEQVPGLPTREELQQWITEHDAIEKETEIFDKGELKKLRQLTKAATQRNLSPEDTDLIELALTTIYELDRLLHLSRGRAENLELLGLRLTWEENRITGWIGFRKLMEDLQMFVTTRARWTPSVYDTMTKEEDHSEIKRRGSVASFASAMSDTSNSIAAFSRGARFKLAELLSRDAAQFASRISNLRHSKISAAGKALDKLIDASRKPVPEVLLDEQDKLEEKGINEMEHVGKFVMNLVMQWRKADEIYVETKKDQVTAQNLFEEIETAKLQHPTARQSISFVSRAESLLKRLSLRGNPGSSNSSFPRPEHFLFLDQYNINLGLVSQLAAEIAQATILAQNSDLAAREYKKVYDSVKGAEDLLQEVSNLAPLLDIIIEKLLKGITNDEGDGSPPNLISETCLELTAHSVYLALLPDLLEQGTTADDTSAELLQRSRPILLALEASGIDASFQATAKAGIQKLSSQRDRARNAREDIVGRVYRLKEARKIWASMGGILAQLEEIRGFVEEAMNKFKWRQQITHSAPLTPDSPPSTPIAAVPTHSELLSLLQQMEPKLSQDIESPFLILSYTLEVPVKEFLSRSILGLKNTFDVTKQLIDVLEAIQAQATVMGAVRDECNAIQVSIEDLKIRLNCAIEDVMTSRLTQKEVVRNEESLQAEISGLESKVQIFVQNLLQRVPFIDRGPRTPNTNSTFVKRRFSLLDSKVGLTQQRKAVELPFELSSLDDAVRADCNSYTIALNGKIENLLQLNYHLKLARMSKEVDNALKPLLDDINDINGSLNDEKARFANIDDAHKLEQLNALLEDLEALSSTHRTRIFRSLSFVREVVRRMQELPGSQDPSVHESLLLSRIRAVDDVELRLNNWFEDLNGFKDQVANACRQESQRLEEIRRAEMHRQQKESMRLAAEEAERLRVEQERLVNKKLKELEEERLAEEERQRRLRERHAAEDAQRRVRERQRREADEQRRLEELRLAEEKRMEEDRLRQAAEEAEKERLHRERLEVEVKLRQVEEQLAEERRITAERTKRKRSRAEERQEHLATKQFTVLKENVFGFRLMPELQQARSPEMLKLQEQILALRKRLRQIKISEALRPSKAATQLPTQDRVAKIRKSLTSISQDVSKLPSSAKDFTVDMELKSLRTEVEASFNLLKRLKDLASLSNTIKSCEAALSDLLEHVDSYPSPPLGILSTTFRPSANLPPEKQLSSRLAFTREKVNDMNTKLALVKDDSRAVAESSTVQQTWQELEEMTNERLGGKRTRPSSVIGSLSIACRSTESLLNRRASTTKGSSYSGLSASTSSAGTPRGRLLAPPNVGTRRAVSGGHEPSKSVSASTRPPSQLSNTSRPLPKSFSPSVYGTTFASRQRTPSLSNSISTPPPGRPPVHIHTPANQDRSTASPTLSDSSTRSRSVLGTSKVSTSTTRSSWSRAPRNSLSSFIPPQLMSPPKRNKQKPTPPSVHSGARKKYVPDPKSKLDVAVGDIVNKLPVGINVEGVIDTWKDKSGKYWIGNQDPKLCFCRILRSQTVMVRVGGGWAELSTFITDHFADSFRIMGDSDALPIKGDTKEKWINAATLLESDEKENDSQGLVPPKPPSTPEPKLSPGIPSFAITTPTGRSPQSISSPSTKSGSPLTPMQFIRRADFDLATGRPVTPSRPPTRARNAPPTPSHSTNKHGVWRP
ncbi:hypothetical protein JOM56_008300 [Amanita muscaria]